MGYNKRIGMVCGLVMLSCQTLWAQDATVTMLEQLAALKGYLHAAEAGYRVVDHGLRLAGDLKQGEFDLHRMFFTSLDDVDTAVRGAPELSAVYRLAAYSDRVFGEAVGIFKASDWLALSELRYIQDVQDGVAGKNEEELRVLEAVVRDGKLSMVDGERLTVINRVAREMRRRYGEVKVFLIEVTRLIATREKEHADIGTLKQWYGLQ